MATLSLADLAGSAAGGGVGGASLGDALRSATDVKRVAAFDDAMGRTTAEASRLNVSETASTATPPSATSAVQDSSSASRERVRRSLDLEGVATRPSEGDAILGGLQRLRGTLDARHARIGSLMEGNSVDTNALISMQMEVAQYTLLIDVSSKLTGKATSSLDTLMKGQ